MIAENYVRRAVNAVKLHKLGWECGKKIIVVKIHIISTPNLAVKLHKIVSQKSVQFM